MTFSAKHVVATVVAAIAVIAVAVLFMYSGAMPAPTAQQYREALLADIRSMVPADAKDCGFVSLDAARADAIACVNASIANKAAFWVSFQEQGEDSVVWSVLIGDVSGGLKVMSFDAQRTVGPDKQIQRHWSGGSCSHLRFNETGPVAMQCS
jgi:hypothetical protein